MANNVHFIHAANGRSTLIVRDDRGSPVKTLELPSDAAEDQADAELQAVGWTRSADWTTADDGWAAPVVPS